MAHLLPTPTPRSSDAVDNAQRLVDNHVVCNTNALSRRVALAHCEQHADAQRHAVAECAADAVADEHADADRVADVDDDADGLAESLVVEQCQRDAVRNALGLRRCVRVVDTLRVVDADGVVGLRRGYCRAAAAARRARR